MSNPRVLAGIVTLALASSIAGCAGSAETREEGSNVDVVKRGPTPTPGDAAAPSEVAEEDRCNSRVLDPSLDTRLCNGRYSTGVDSEPFAQVKLPPPSGKHLKWFGGAYSPTDLQFRQGRSGCDGCEIGVLEVLIVGRFEQALRTLKGLRNLGSLQTTEVEIGGRRALEIEGRFGKGVSHAFGGLEFTRGELDARLIEFGSASALTFLSSDDPGFLADAEKVVRTLVVRDA